ncbi:MAG: hypothetical protein J7L47_07810 [Candidatus Odinarchaeota archaeon]|nr:hypothetical protein [Candidatus Odinarchaeota archaeon]
MACTFGIDELDKELAKNGLIVHIFGEKGLGKSTLAYLAMINALKKDEKSIVYLINIGFAFDPRRLNNLVLHYGTKEMLERIKVFNISTFHEQAKLFDLLPLFAVGRNIRLIAIDRFTTLFLNNVLQLKKSHEKTYYNLELNRECAILHYIANKSLEKNKDFCVLLINDVIYSPKHGTIPIAKAILDFWTDYRLFLFEEKESAEKRKIMIIEPEKNVFSYEITDYGFSISKINHRELAE